MSKEIGFYSRMHGKTGDKTADREAMKAFAEKVLAPERIKRTKGLMWIDDEGMVQLEAALKRPDEPREIEPNVVTALIIAGAKNPRFEFGWTEAREKIGIMIPSGRKGKLVGRKVQVEVITANDGEKSYRLLCPSFQKLSN
jgi:hypothetical protein